MPLYRTEFQVEATPDSVWLFTLTMGGPQAASHTALNEALKRRCEIA